MTSKHFLDQAKALSEVLNLINNVTKHIKDITNFGNELDKNFVALFNAYAHNNPTVTMKNLGTTIPNVKNVASAVGNIVKASNSYILMRELHSLVLFLDQNEYWSESGNVIEKQVEYFFDLHSKVLANPTIDRVSALVRYCVGFSKTIEKYRYASSLLLKNLKDEPYEIKPHQEKIDIFIDSGQNTLESFTKFLVYMDGLYHELIKSFELHYDEYPLTVIKIESGSNWSNLLGHKDIIDLIKYFIGGLGGFIRDLIVGNIRKERINNQIDASILLLELRERAKKAGVSEPKLQHIDKVFSGSISKLEKAFPQNTTAIYIDNQEILNISPADKKALISKQIKSLNAKSDVNPDNTSSDQTEEPPN